MQNHQQEVVVRGSFKGATLPAVVILVMGAIITALGLVMKAAVSEGLGIVFMTPRRVRLW